MKITFDFSVREECREIYNLIANKYKFTEPAIAEPECPEELKENLVRSLFSFAYGLPRGKK